MATILNRIVEQTREDLNKRMREISFREFESMELYGKERLDFRRALDTPGTVSVIAEVKKASPSKGIIRHDFNPVQIAESYIEGGASAISVLTDAPFFQGNLSYLADISSICPVPTLRKDFIIHPYQIKEARGFGADAILLIASMYDGAQLAELLSAAEEFGIQALVECYEEEEFLNLPWNLVDIVGVNNRDLNTFDVDVHRGVAILSRAPGHVITVSESGLRQPEDIGVLHQHGIHAALIGEYFMKQENPGEAVKKLMEHFIKKHKTV